MLVVKTCFWSKTDPPSPPLNPRVSSTQNQPSSSIITLEWDPPSSTGGVSVSYVLTISPTPLSGSPVTVETTSAQITVSYNTPYNVTIRAVNCAGMSQESLIVDLSKPFHGRNYYNTCMYIVLFLQWCAPHRLLLLVWPSPTHLLSLLVDPCSPSLAGGDNEVRTSTCGSSGWSPDPGTFDCGTPVTGIIHGQLTL